MLLLQPWPGVVLGALRRGSHRVVKAGVHCGRRSTQTLGPMGPHRHKQRLLHARKLRPRETQTTRPRSSSYHRGEASRMATELCSQPPLGCLSWGGRRRVKQGRSSRAWMHQRRWPRAPGPREDGMGHEGDGGRSHEGEGEEPRGRGGATGGREEPQGTGRSHGGDERRHEGEGEEPRGMGRSHGGQGGATGSTSS